MHLSKCAHKYWAEESGLKTAIIGNGISYLSENVWVVEQSSWNKCLLALLIKMNECKWHISVEAGGKYVNCLWDGCWHSLTCCIASARSNNGGCGAAYCSLLWSIKNAFISCLFRALFHHPRMFVQRIRLPGYFSVASIIVVVVWLS